MEPSRRFLLSDYDGAVMAPSFSPPPSAAPFRPGIAVVVGVLTSVFSITFLLLLYAKHCKRGAASESSAPYGSGGGGGERRNSGVERAVVESLPVFRYGALRGQKAGLECAVCLGRFEAAEALRLLPKCRHGFHVECVDTWLDAHSTCPLCRARVDPEDVLLLPETPKPSTTGPPEPDPNAATVSSASTPTPPSGKRISGRHSTGSVLAAARAPPASRRSADLHGGAAVVGCFEIGRVRKDRVLMVAAAAEPDREAYERRFGHRILVGAGECEAAAAEEPAARQRWSDLRPSDLMFLRSEMLVAEGGRYSCSAAAGGGGGGGGRGVAKGRSLSELAGVSRLAPVRAGAGAEEGAARAASRRWPGSRCWAPAPNGPSA